MPGKKLYITITLGVVATFLSCRMVFAVDDGFLAQKKIPGDYLTLYCDSGVEVPSLVSQLNIGPSDRILAGKSAEVQSSPEQELTEMLDILFIRVSDILDIHLYSFEGSIKVCRDNTQLGRIYSGLFGRNLNNMSSFYVHTLKTIYISAASFNIGVLGHELAHALICHYFVVPPSVNIQEVLAGYVEYQLRKSPRM